MSNIPKLDHIGIAVPDIEKALPLYRGLLESGEVSFKEVPAEGVRVGFLSLGGVDLEFLEPLPGRESAIARFLEKRGPGVHHIAFRTDNLALKMKEIKGAGFDLVDEQARIVSSGRRVCFIHPKAAAGVLVELVEAA